MALLEGLDAVDWRNASHTRGLATDIPDLLRALLDPARRAFAVSMLCDRLEHQLTVWSASSKAVPFLVEILMTGPDDRDLRRAVLGMLMSILGEHLEVLPDRYDPAEFYADIEDPGTWRDEDRNTWREDEEVLKQMTKVWGKACYDAIEAALPALLPLIDDEDDELALRVITMLEIFPNSAALIAPALRRLDTPKVSEARREAVRAVLSAIAANLHLSGDRPGRPKPG